MTEPLSNSIITLVTLLQCQLITIFRLKNPNMKKFTAVCIGVVVLIFLAMIGTCVQIGILTNSTKTEDPSNCLKDMRMQHVIALSERNSNMTLTLAERFPYVSAITRNSSNLWSFACFASVILFKWVVTSAHCRRAGFTHRVMLYHDYAHNQTYALPILLWRIHEKFNMSSPTPKYDIAVAKLNLAFYPHKVRPATFDETEGTEIEASVWKTVSTMDRKLYLTNHFEKYEVRIANAGKCFESYGVEVDSSLICVDMSDYDECFVHEFGPIFSGDKVVGIIAVKSPDCDIKLSIFTNVSYYANWLLRTTHDG